MALPECDILITDLDNTLWDWFAIWTSSFRAMLVETSRISGISATHLEHEIRAVHQEFRTTEYAFVLEELPSLRKFDTREGIREKYTTAYAARSSARRLTCRLYPGARETLETLRERGTMIVGYTESMAFYTSDRLRLTGLDDVIDVLYSAADHTLPEGLTPSQLRKHPADHYEHRRTVHRHTPPGATKPSAAILQQIIAELGADLQRAVYVGDSLMKDVAMAKDAGVRDVWARYGESHAKEEYRQLVRVSHWSAADVERERALTERDVVPTYVIDAFGELLNLFQFGMFRASLQEPHAI